MWELIWFLLGAIIYRLLVGLFGISQKVKFIEDIRISAFVLIGRSFEELLKIHILKYSLLKNESAVPLEQIKLLKNEDAAFLDQWRKDAVINLNESVPSLYKKCIDLKDWSDLMDVLMKAHAGMVESIEKLDAK
tara:strand:- start:130 stop:531 length:402 start_codon:yes stop_codon:yes gene_type:complete